MSFAKRRFKFTNRNFDCFHWLKEAKSFGNQEVE